MFCTWAYYPHATGGAERQAQLQAEELSRRGHTVAVLTPRWPGTRTGSINGVWVWRLPILPIRPFITLSYVVSAFIYGMVRMPRFDFASVHLAYFQADAVVIAALILRRPVWAKVAASGRMGEIARMRRVLPVTPLIGLRFASRVQATSEAIVEELRAVGVREDRIVRIPNGVDVTRFTPADAGRKRQLRRELSLPEDPVITLFVGRLARHKGIDDLESVWRDLNPPNSVLLMVGSDRTMDRAKGNFSGPSLIVRPWAQDIDRYYQCADVFVLPSHVEGMSNALLEAMASGLAVIATRVGASESMVTHGRNGLLIDAGNQVELKLALARLISNGDERMQMGLEARRTTVDRFSIQSVVDRLESAYADLS